MSAIAHICDSAEASEHFATEQLGSPIKWDTPLVFVPLKVALQNLQVNLRLEPGKSISFFAASGTSTVEYLDQSFLSKFLYFVAMQINKHSVQIFEVLCGFETYYCLMDEKFIEEENLLVSGAGDGTVKFWNLDLDNPIIYNAHLN